MKLHHRISSHLKHHHQKYLFGFLGSAVIASLVFTLGLNTFFPSHTFAASPLCSSNASNQAYERISRVKVNTTQQNTAKAGYLDYTATPIATLNAGVTYPVEIDVGTTSAYQEYVKIWLDMNQNGTIEDPAELVYNVNQSVTTLKTFTGNITIPSSAYNGQIYMRVIMQYAATPALCGTYTYGGTQDYLINVVGATSNPVNKTLTVTTGGSGIGNVTSSPAGINIVSGINSFDYSSGTAITLTAIPGASSTFSGRGGNCSGTSTGASVTLNTGKTCTATFNSIAAPTAPTVTCTNFTSGTTGNYSSTISCTATDTASPSARTKVQYSINGGSTWSDTISQSLTTPAFTPAEGTTDFRMRLFNAGGTGTTSTAYYIKKDTTAPTITITQPNTNPATSKTITASTSEGTLTMTAGSTSTTCNASRTFITYASTAFTSEADNGKYVCYRAIDNAGNTGYLNSTPAISGIDTTAPTITITQPNTNPATSKTITASASDGTLTMTAGSTSTTCNASRTFITYASTAFASEADNGKYVCYRAIDSAGNTGYLNSTPAISGIDKTAPTITQITAVPSTINDSTPNYICSSTEVGTITYGGSCTSSTTNATVGSNTITFNTLADATYSNCTIKVTDAAGNQGNALSVNTFTVIATATAEADANLQMEKDYLGMIGSDYPDDYTATTVSVVTAAFALSETNNAEKITKTNALHAAYAGLQTKLNAAKAAAATKVQADYTAGTWATLTGALAGGREGSVNARNLKATAITNAIAALVTKAEAEDDDIVNIPSDTNNKENIITAFTIKGYKDTEGSLKEVPVGTYVGTKKINTVNSHGKILVPFIQQSSGSTKKIEADFPVGVVAKDTSGNNFEGLIDIPREEPLTKATDGGLNTAVTVVSFGSTGGSIHFVDTGNNPIDITLRIPLSGQNAGDTVDIYYSIDNGSTWNFQTTTTGINISGTIYAEFTTTHFTDFAVTLPAGGGSFTGTFVINNDNASTTSNSVILNMSTTPSAINMRFSNDGLTRSSRESYATTKGWTLPGSYGTKTVYAQFDADGNGTSDADINDSISYSAPSGGGCIGGSQLVGGIATACLHLEITGMSGHCTYGNVINFGIKDFSYIAKTYTTGFLTTVGNSAWYCDDTEGKSDWNMTIQSNTIVNANNSGWNIPASRVFIKNPAATKINGECTPYIGDSNNVRTPLSGPVSIIGKTSGPGEICKIQTNSVVMEIDTLANQAVGNYSGTLTLSVPLP